MTNTTSITWTTPTILNVSTGTKPEIIAIDGQILVVWGNKSDSVIYQAFYTPSTATWTTPAAISSADGTTPWTLYGAPSLAAIDDRVLMVWVSGDGSALYQATYNPKNGSWSASSLVTDDTGAAIIGSYHPGMASLFGCALLAHAITQDNGDTPIYASLYCSSSTGADSAAAEQALIAYHKTGKAMETTPITDVSAVWSWSPPTPTEGGSTARPALTAVEDTILMAWKGAPDDTRIFCSTYTPSTDSTSGVNTPTEAEWSQQINLSTSIGTSSIPVKTSTGPALTAWESGRVLLVWKAENDSKLYQAEYNGISGSWLAPSAVMTSSKAYLKAYSGTSLTALSGDLYLAYRTENAATISFSIAKGETSTASWMDWSAKNISGFSNKTLGQIVMPGSHDAGMYPYTIACILGKTQNICVYDQLLAGTRYFDLRPVMSSNEFYAYHGYSYITGGSIKSILKDVAKFMKGVGAKEIVILKFSHYGDGFDSTQYCQLIAGIEEEIGSYLFKTAGLTPATAKVSQLQGKVVVVCDGDYPLSYPSDNIYVYRDGATTCPQETRASDPSEGSKGLVVYDCYSNTTDYSAMKADQLAKFSAYTGMSGNGTTPCAMYLMSWTLTPCTAVWFFAKEANAGLYSALSDLNPNASKKIPNIIFVDYGEYSDATKLCIRLNKTYASMTIA